MPTTHKEGSYFKRYSGTVVASYPEATTYNALAVSSGGTNLLISGENPVKVVNKWVLIKNASLSFITKVVSATFNHIKVQDSVSAGQYDLYIIENNWLRPVTVVNDGDNDIYVNGEILLKGESVKFTKQDTDYPIVVYGTDTFLITNGEVEVSSAFPVIPVVIGSTVRFAPTTVNALYIEDAQLVAGLLEANIEVFHNGSRLIEGVHYNRTNLAINRLDAMGAFNYSLTADIWVTLFY
jgi:hypothetical protein